MKLKAISKYFKIFDMFGETSGFTFENGSKKYNSVIGAILSLLVLTAVAFQSAEKYDILISRSDTNY